jgi:hypothetical protein
MKKIINGFLDVFKNKRLIARLYLFYLGSYLLFFVLYRSFLSKLDSLENIGAESLDRFDFSYLFILLKDAAPLSNLLASVLLILLFIYFIFSQYTLKRFTENLSSQINRWKNFWRMIFSWLYVIPPAAFTIISIAFVYRRSRDLITVNPNSATTMEIVAIGLTVLLGVFLFSLLDTTRILSISSNLNSFKANLFSYKFVLRNYLKFLILYVVYGIFFSVFVYFYNQVMYLTERIRWDNILLLFIFHLLFFLIQLLIKFIVYSLEFQIVDTAGLKDRLKTREVVIGKKPVGDITA